MIAFPAFLSRIASLQLVNVGISEIEVVSSQLDHLADSKTEDKNISWRNTRPVDRIPLAKKIMEHLTDSEETNMRSKW